MKRDKQAIRAALVVSDKIDFTADVFALSHSQRCALRDAAKAHGYRKSITSCLSTGAAFFVYLVKELDAAPAASGHAKRWNNHNIAKG